MWKFNPFTGALDYYEEGTTGGAGGDDAEIQYNDLNNFSGTPNFKVDKVTGDILLKKDIKLIFNA